MAGSTRTPTLMALLCLGLCRGPGDQVQAGTLPKPSIWAEPGPVVPVESPVTIWCQGSPQAEDYQLYKEGDSAPVLTEVPQSSSDKVSFSIKDMRARWAGRYQCSYRSLHGWSERSDPLTLVLIGAWSAPSLSAQPSSVVASGGRVTLSCSSERPWDTFHLLKEGSAGLGRQMDSPSPQGTQQALFPVGPVSPSHAGTYRCYGSVKSRPHQWSRPSAPLCLRVTGSESHQTDVLIGVSVTLVLLLVLLLLFLLLWHRHWGAHRKWGPVDPTPWDGTLQTSSSSVTAAQETPDATQTDAQPEGGLPLDPQQNTADEDPQGTSSPQEKCSVSKEEVASSSSPLSGGQLGTRDGAAGECKQMASQAAASEDLQEVTYAQLTLMTQGRATESPPSQAEDSLAESSMYAAPVIR